MELRPINYPQALKHDFDEDPMPRLDYNWRTGEPAASQEAIDAWWSRQDAKRKLDWEDADAIAWRAYSKAWPEAMSWTREVRYFGMAGQRLDAADTSGIDWSDAVSGLRVVSFCSGNQPVIKYEPPAPLDWGDAVLPDHLAASEAAEPSGEEP